MNEDQNGQPEDPQADPGPEAPETGEETGFRIPGEILAAIAAIAASSMRRSINERHVHGSVIEQTAAFVRSEIKPEVIELEEPGTGILALGLLTKTGLVPVASSIFDASRDTPRYRAGEAQMLSLDSFIAHVCRYADGHSAVFANNDRAKPSLLAVLDYNETGSDGSARFGEHRTSFAFPLSDEWKAWQAMDAKPMSMREFAAFLEDRIIDVMPLGMVDLGDEAKRFVETLGGQSRLADPAKLMELSTGLHIYESSVVKEATRLSSGEGAIEFQVDHTDATGQKLNVPSMFVIGIPVFANGQRYQVIARLRYRKNGGQIVFFYELWRTDRVFDHAFDEAVDRVRVETSTEVFLGVPETGSVGRGGVNEDREPF